VTRREPRLLRPLCAVVLLLAQATAQADALPATVRVEARYGGDAGALRDHAPQFVELLRRHGAAGLRVRVTLPPAAAARHAATSPPYEVAAAEDAGEQPAVTLTGLPGIEYWSDRHPDAFEDLIVAARQPDAAVRFAEMVKAWRYVQGRLEDGPAVPNGAARLVELFPHSGEAGAFRYLDAVWYRGDFDAARAAAEASLRALREHPWPLVRFCDLVLRADANDRALAASVAAALAPVIAASPDAPFARLCWLRARLRAEPAQVTAADVEQVLQRVEHDGEAACTLAEILANAPRDAAFEQLAERSLAAAEEAGAGGRAFAATEILLAQRAGDGQLAATRVELFVREFLPRGSEAYALNTLAWDLLVRLRTTGRFDAVALALMERVRREQGERMNDAHLDTLALALYGTGRIDDAIACQQRAIADTDGDPRYECRLRRYQRARELARRR
jgi:hypothetical protein